MPLIYFLQRTDITNKVDLFADKKFLIVHGTADGKLMYKTTHCNVSKLLVLFSKTLNLYYSHNNRLLDTVITTGHI